MVSPPWENQIWVDLQESFKKIVKKTSFSPVLLETSRDTSIQRRTNSALLSQWLFPELYWDTHFPSNHSRSASAEVCKSNSANRLHPPTGFPWPLWELSLRGRQETQGTSLKYRRFVFSLWNGAALPYLKWSEYPSGSGNCGCFIPGKVSKVENMTIYTCIFYELMKIGLFKAAEDPPTCFHYLV